MKWWKRKKKKQPEPQWQFTEGVDFLLIPDLERVRKGDPHPWNIQFAGRVIKVHSLKIPEAPDANGDFRVAVKAQVLYGEDLNSAESQTFGNLLMELVQRNMYARD